MIESTNDLKQLDAEVWALHPKTFEELTTFTVQALKDPAATYDQEAYSAFLKKEQTGKQANYDILEGGVARIPVTGVLQRRLGLFAFLFGGSSTVQIQNDLKTALADDQIKAILLDIDSPGGSVHGTMELAETIFEGRKEKPIIAYTGGQMSSAAYWIGAAADTVIAFDTAMVGSIGVAVTHFDVSKMDEQIGVKRTIIAAGKYKRMTSDEKPLSKEGRELLQGLVDTYYGLFIGAIGKYRGVDKETVHSKMGDGREFIGKQALNAGLVDHIGNFEFTTQQIQGGLVMNLEQLREKHPELYDEVFKLGAESVTLESMLDANPQIVKTYETTGIEHERARVTEILEVQGPVDVKIQAIKGGLEVKDAFKLLLDTDLETRNKNLEQMKQAASPPVGTETVETHTVPSGDPETDAKTEWEKDAELRAEFGNDFNRFFAWKKADTLGLVRIKSN